MLDEKLNWDQRFQRWLPLALIAVVLLAYSNSYSGVFIFDDTVIIQKNANIQHFWPPWKAVLRPTRWLADMSYALNFAIGGLNPADFHAGNVLIHLGATLLLFGLIRRVLVLSFWAGRWTGSSSWLAAAIAGLWAAHPLQTECVTYIVQRDESLMGFFFLLTLYLYVRSVGSPRPRLWVDLALLACLIGMGTKEMMVAIPILVVLFDVIFVCSSWREALAQRWKVYLAFSLLWGVFFIQLLHIMPDEFGLQAAKGFQGFSRGEYLLTQFEVIPHYLRLVFYPVGQCFDYLWMPTENLWVLFWPGMVLWGIIGAAVIGVLKRRPIGWVAAAFLLILAPTSSLMPLSDMAVEHRMYLPLAAVLATVLLGIYAGLGRVLSARSEVRRDAILLGMVAAGIVALGTMTYLRNRDYSSETRLWQDVVSKRPENWRAYLGVSKGLLEKRDYLQVAHLAEQVSQKMPDYAAQRDLDVNALTSSSTRIRIQVKYFAMLHNNLGAAQSQLRRTDEAISHYRTVLRFLPDDSSALNNLGYELFRQGRTNEAVRYWFAVLNTEPMNAPAHGFIGMIYENRKDWGKALKHYEAVLITNPGQVYYQYRVAWLLSVVPDPNMRDVRRAWDLSQIIMRETDGQSAKAWDLQGIIWAARGDFDRAMECADKALALVVRERRGMDEADFKGDRGRFPLNSAEVEERQALYRDKKLYYLSVHPSSE